MFQLIKKYCLYPLISYDTILPKCKNPMKATNSHGVKNTIFIRFYFQGLSFALICGTVPHK